MKDSLTLSPGTYEVTKKLSVSRYGLNYYRDSIFLKKDTCSALVKFIKAQAILQNRSTCVPDCKTCYDSVGSWDSFRGKFWQIAGLTGADTANFVNDAWVAYQQALDQCKALCDTATGEQDDVRLAMLSDVSAPSGQYANPNNIDSYSIFYTSVSQTIAPYKNNSLVYLNERGLPDKVTDKNGNLVRPQDLDVQGFVQNFKASWAAALLPSHPEYCKLLQYDGIAGSFRWDRKVSKIDTYTEALSKGYLNPTANTASPFNTYTAVTANIDSLATKDTSIKRKLEDSLKVYKKIPVNGVLRDVSLWTMATMMAKCNNDSVCMKDHILNTRAFESLSCDADKNMAWRIFRGLYLQVKRNVISDLINAAACTGYTNHSSSELVTAGHFPNFNDAVSALNQNGLGYLITSNPSDTTRLKDSIKTALGNYYNENCEAYATAWVQQLSPCNYPADSVTNVIIPRLIAVCRKGADTDHPYGSRNISPDSTNNFLSFDDVIKDYNRKHTITDTIACNADLINVPKSYEQPAIYSNKPVISKPSSCECDRINALYLEYTTNAVAGDTSFSAYLLRQYHTKISDADLTALRNSCNNVQTCNYFIEPVYLPPALQCNSGDICITCNQLNVLEQQFETAYDTVPVYTFPGDTAYNRVNILFANFMNNRLGFSKEPYEYLAFMRRCSNAGVNGGGTNKCVSCDSLQKLVTAYFYTLQQRSTIQGAGTEDSMLLFIHNALLLNGLDASTYQIKTALDNCSRGWKQNVSFTSPYSFTFKGYDTLWGTPTTGRNLDIGANNQSLSIEFWVNLTNVPNSHFQAIASYYNRTAANFTSPVASVSQFQGYRIYADSGHIYAQFGDNSSTYNNGGSVWVKTDSALSSLKWHHIVIEKTGKNYSDIKIYVNNSLLVTQSVGNATYMNNGSVSPIESRGLEIFNCSYSGGWGRPTPQMRNFRLYNRVLPVSEIQSNYFNCSELPANMDSLKLWAKLDEGRGRARDYSIYNTPSRYLGEDFSGFDTTTKNINSWTGGYGPAKAPSCLPVIASALCNYPIADSLLLCGKSEPVFAPDTSKPVTNCSDSLFFAESIGTELYRVYKDSVKGNFDSCYRSKCLNAYKLESFTVTHEVSEYHYTLYYYDQAGNLVKTVPPQGVNAIRRQSWLDSVASARTNNQSLTPVHKLATQYRYNSLNQEVARLTPDAGKSTSYYDRLGRPVLSQNAKQFYDNKKYSYTLYDYLGRKIQVGELQSTATMNSTISKDQSQLQTWLSNAASTRTQITQTTYDQQYIPLSYLMKAKNLRNRVSWTALYNTAQDMQDTTHAAASFFSYDIHGNVDTLIQDFKSGSMATLQNRFKKIVYKYDLISGKVNEVKYQPNQADAFYHQYIYDEENRIANVLTSADSSYWENEASYSYYKHGPVGRVVIGDQRVQGVDYAYTLQGWLKGINSTSMSPNFDMGADGNNGDPVARDAFGLVLNYYGSQDYKAITKSKIAFDTSVAGNFKPLYNGNIASMGVNIGSLGNAMLYSYTYDQLNRLTSMQTSAKALNTSSNKWTFGTWNNYKENISYDGNGNILKYNRYNASAIMDSLAYSYYTGTNRLNNINDKVADNVAATDIDNQAVNNYAYDSIGNLIKDVKEGLDSIQWTVYGKIKQVNKVGGIVIKYSYDASGNRISKDVNGKQEWYVRDAGGNVMSVYSKGDSAINNGVLSQSEIDLYGSSRLGVWKPHINVQNIVRGDSIWLRGLQTWARYTTFTRGEKYYEVTDHRGNVMAVVSDKKTGTDGNNDGVVNYYVADVVSASDTYPGGFEMPGRTYNPQNAVNGFNGKRKDNEIYGEGNAYDFGDRIYDSRGVVWLSIDRLQKKYPGESNYAYVSNNPIIYADADGKDKIYTLTIIDKDGKSTTIKKVDKDYFVYTKVEGRLFNTFYKSDLNVNVTIDLSGKKNQITYTEGESNMKQISRGNYYLAKAGQYLNGLVGNTNGSSRGSQPSGITLTSEFTKNADGPKTDATKGPQGMMNVDALSAAFGAFGQSGEALKFDLGDLPEWMALGKEIIEVSKDFKKGDEGTSDNKNSPIKRRSFVIVRDDNYFPGEPKGSVQDHAYIGDSTTKFKPSKNKGGIDTFYEKHVENK